MKQLLKYTMQSIIICMTLTSTSVYADVCKKHGLSTANSPSACNNGSGCSAGRTCCHCNVSKGSACKGTTTRAYKRGSYHCKK